MVKVNFEYDDGCGCKTSYSKEIGEESIEFQGELETINQLYLEFLMACGFPFTYKDEVVVVEDGDLETIYCDCCNGECEDYLTNDCEDEEDLIDFILNVYSEIE